jgi:exo-beta-1,3-glucanase (GH17 family)
MNQSSYKKLVLAAAVSVLFACGDQALNGGGDTPPSVTPPPGDGLEAQIPATGAFPKARNGDTLLGNPNYPAISYGPFRTTVRDEANVPSVEELKEDLRIMEAMGIKVLRTYNTQGFSDTAKLLVAIDELMAEDANFEMYVMLGIWIEALNSWTDQPVIHDQESPNNDLEMAAAIEMVKQYPEIIKVMAVGNEAMVHWAPYHVVPAIILDRVNELQQLKRDGDIPADVWITSSDNFASWGGENDYKNDDLAALIAAVDYISMHTYPFHDTHYNNEFWLVPEDEQQLSVMERVDSAMVRAHDYALSQVELVQDHMQSLDLAKQIHIGETGWSSYTNYLYGEAGSKAADEYKQKAYYDSMRSWSEEWGASLFFFQAFDEPWKGDQNNPGDSEKHFGLIDIEGNAKYVIWDMVDNGVFDGLTRGGMEIVKSFGGVEQNVLDTVVAPDNASGPIEGDVFEVLGTALLQGGLATGWEGTAWAGVDEATAILTLATPPTGGTKKDWGWGASIVPTGAAFDLTGFENGVLEFEIKGTTTTNIQIGFKTGRWDLGNETSNYVIFGPSGNPVTTTWTKYSIPVAELNSGNANFADVSNIFYFQGTVDDGGEMEVKNIVFKK